jgi:tetratricopeptide (TPR) repeat protein
VEGRWELDAAGRAAIGLLTLALGCAASAGDDFQRGAELARSGRWDEARLAFLAGERQAPRDKRFPLELAGVEYRRKNFAQVKRELRRALKLDPGDRYGNDFLGTMYYLEGNLDAALRYWNRIAKPEIDDLKIEPQPRVSPLLLDSSLTFTPASLLTLDELWTTEARLDALDLFNSYRIELPALPEEHFDAAVRGLRLPGWIQLVSSLRGIAYQTVEPSLRDIGGSGVNWDTLLRWDAQKRRAGLSLAGPLFHQAKWRYRWYADARSETWNAGAAEDFRLQRLASGFEFRAIPSWRLSWDTGVEVSSRQLAALQGFPGGTVLKYSAGLNYQLLRMPEHRFTVGSSVNWDLGRLVSGSGGLFSQNRASIEARWLPQARGDDYEMNAQVRAGTTQGTAPFDELFMLGVERDNDLWLRGHPGTLNGKKGSAPMGRNYFLANWDFQKQIYRRTFFTVATGPFLDAGRTDDAFGRGPFRQWMVDSGMEVSVRILGAVRVSLIYGRDLRGGGHVTYATAGAPAGGQFQ